MADAFGDEAEPTISIGEYLEGVEEQELEADLVLGGDEGKECTYDKGYLKRQAIFSCLTCTPDGNAGICTACSLSCHDGHEIVELWTKRKFRCDCGNSKFGEFYCKLSANKDLENVENSYNHNFKGLYCTCKQPYPDPDAEEQVEMIQCCICEDWFHEEHLGLPSAVQIPRDEEGEPLYEDLICQGCSDICFFLNLYPQTIKAAVREQNATSSAKEKEVKETASLPQGSPRKLENEDLEQNATSSAKEKEVIETVSLPRVSPRKLENKGLEQNATSSVKVKEVIETASLPQGSPRTLENKDLEQNATSSAKEREIIETASLPQGSPRKLENKDFLVDTSASYANSEEAAAEKHNLLEVEANSTASGGCGQAVGPSKTCILGINLLEAASCQEKGGAMFLSKNWREFLCRCGNCTDFYTQKGISFLLDEDDSIAEYEKMAKQRRDEKLQQQQGLEMNFLNKLGHVEKMELLSGIADMKNEIHSFLESCDTSKPITAADVHQVFENLAKKRKRMP